MSEVAPKIEKEEKTVALEFEKPLEEINQKISELRRLSEQSGIDLKDEIKKMEERSKLLKIKIYSELTPSQIVQIARHPNRPTTLDYIDQIFEEWLELKGDRHFGDDPAMIGGFGLLNGQGVVIIGQQKGRTTKMRLFRNFGMAQPEGYRKALRLMRQAEKFGKPSICFIDTPGAYPGIGAEERGQAEAIAVNLREMIKLTVPVICIITGEGASGGALGIGVGNKVAMLKYSWYGVISPEGCASILWKDSTKSSVAAETMRITADNLLKLGVIDEIINEPVGGAHNNLAETAGYVKDFIVKTLGEYQKLAPQKIQEERFMKFRKMGFFKES
jgi:acetyl-CoA carboxylase carboxyl transferase subunit alpha